MRLNSEFNVAVLPVFVLTALLPQIWLDPRLAESCLPHKLYFHLFPRFPTIVNLKHFLLDHELVINALVECLLHRMWVGIKHKLDTIQFSLLFHLLKCETSGGFFTIAPH